MFCSLLPQDERAHKDPSDVYKAVSVPAFSSIDLMPVCLFFLTYFYIFHPLIYPSSILSILIFRCKFVYLCLQMLPLIFECLEKKL